MTRLEFISLMGGLKMARQDNRDRFWTLEKFLPSKEPEVNGFHPAHTIFLEALVASHVPQVAAITGFQSFEELWAARVKSGRYRASVTLLQTTVHSTEIDLNAELRKPSRIFELRVYRSPTSEQLKALHECAGIHPILQNARTAGENMPNLTYLIPFESLAAREKAWGTLGSDPEWVKVRESSSVIEISLFSPPARSS